jgi:hypothetical protein
MSHQTDPSDQAIEATAHRLWPFRLWEFVYLLALVVSLLAAFIIKSNKWYMSHDDLCTTTLISNPRFGEMIETIGNGGEVNPPLLFVIGWLVARVFGTGDIPMRGLAAVPLAFGAVVVFFALRRTVGPRPAALATALVFGLSRAVFDFMQNARYYGFFILFAAFAALLFVKITAGKQFNRRDLVFIFLAHTAMIWLHLFGLFFSGMWLVALIVVDWFQRQRRWSLYGAVIAAWGTFALWLPALRRQLQVTRDGTWTPRIPFGLFIDEPSMQTPLATVLLLLAAIAVVILNGKCSSETERKTGSVKNLLPLLVLGLAWMAVLVGAWAGSYVIKPFYLQRYVAPCVIALTFLLAVMVWLIERLPGDINSRLPTWLQKLTWCAITIGCLLFQPLRALQDARQLAPFVNLDFGHPNLPMVFEDSMDYLPRAHYGRGREYVMLIGREAAEADSGYFTKLEERLFSKFRPHYADKIRVLYFEELPAWPDGFLVVDVERAKTWDWVAEHKPGLKIELLGQWPEGQKVFLVRREKK